MTEDEKIKKKQEKKKQELYKKILNNDMFTITDVAHIFNKKTSTIRTWEAIGLIPKVKKYSQNEDNDEMHKRRMYTRQELYDTINNVLNFNWTRNCLDRKELTTIMEYIKINLDIENTKRTR